MSSRFIELEILLFEGKNFSRKSTDFSCEIRKKLRFVIIKSKFNNKIGRNCAFQSVLLQFKVPSYKLTVLAF